MSWQPPGAGPLRASHAYQAMQSFFDLIPHAERHLHHTMLNLASGPNYKRKQLLEETNQLIEHFGFKSVNEDLGHWSVDGWPLPYPAAPRFTPEGIRWCARQCRNVDRQLTVPLLVEFPGYDRDAVGPDAYDGFRAVIQQSGCRATLDTGHLLTYRYHAGFRGEALLDGLERLPLDHVVELHCAGVVHDDSRMIDAHHGILNSLQLELVARLLEMCPHLARVTYEDPRFGADGELPAPGEHSLRDLECVVADWRDPLGSISAPRAREDDLDAEAPLDWLVPIKQQFWEESRRGMALRHHLLHRRKPGLDKPARHFAAALGPDPDDTLRKLLSKQPNFSAMRFAVPGQPFEDVLGRRLEDAKAHAAALVCLLATDSEPDFDVPKSWIRTPSGWAHIDDEQPPNLLATRNGQVLKGPITPLLAQLIRGETVDGAELERQELRRMGLLPD